jgi:hypothetical protein
MNEHFNSAEMYGINNAKLSYTIQNVSDFNLEGMPFRKNTVGNGTA